MKKFKYKFNKRTLILLIAFIFSFQIIMSITSKYYNQINLKKKYILELYNNERFLKSEVGPKNKAEEIIIEFFKIQISDEYKRFKDILVVNDYFDHYGDMYKSKKDLGIYYNEIIIHEINELEEGEYSNEEDKVKFYNYIDKLEKYNPSEFKIIEVNYSNRINEDIEENEHLGSGLWTSYFVVVRKRIKWKIFDIYGHIQ